MTDNAGILGYSDSPFLGRARVGETMAFGLCDTCGGKPLGSNVDTDAAPCSCPLEPRTAAQAKRERGVPKAIVGTFPNVPRLTELQAITIARGDKTLLDIWTHPEYQTLLRNLTSVQARCTELIQEVRSLKAARVLASEMKGAPPVGSVAWLEARDKK